MIFNFDKRRFNKRMLSAGSVIVCAVFLFLVNLVFYLLAQNNSFLNFDLTRDKLFKLSPDTATFLKVLD